MVKKVIAMKLREKNLSSKILRPRAIGLIAHPLGRLLMSF